MAQLAAAERPLALSDIEALDGLGPNPWLSFTAARSPMAVAAWQAVVAQLPDETFDIAGTSSIVDNGFTYAEAEGADEVGVNDTVETGEPIDGFGTGDGDEQVVTITGNLSGIDGRVPIDGDCESVEDDGSIPLANPTPAVEFQVALCAGEAKIGDGPHGETTGDFDFFSYGVADEGSLLILDVVNASQSLDPLSSIIGIYDADGNLLGSAEDLASGSGFLSVVAPATGEYYGVVGGCCELPSDPFDPASGPGVAEVGDYEVFVVAFPPPCSSSEDDGALDLANDTAVFAQGGDSCLGEIGDGPHGDADTDWYRIGEVPEGVAIAVDVFALEEPFDSVIGVYDAGGQLLASAESIEGFAQLIYEVTSGGEFYVAVAGCCELQLDPTDPASGVSSDQGGLYEINMFQTSPPCVSSEDDGALGLANNTRVAEQGGEACRGEIGDGPHGNADTDWYRIGEVAEGELAVVDAFSGGEGETFDMVVGIYDDAGQLVASAEASEGEGFVSVSYEVTTTGDYYAAIAGCCELQSDPNDSASGAVSDQTGSYDMIMFRQLPACDSLEEDGSIGDANNASGVSGDDDLFEVICVGFVGDGAFAETTGDVDFYQTRVLPEDRLLIVDFFNPEGPTDAGDLTIGVYNAAGELIGSGQDDPGEVGPSSDFFSITTPAEGEYFIAMTGGLPTDPFDPGSGTNVDIVSDYFAFVVDTTEEFIGGGGATAWGDSITSQRPSQSVKSAAEPGGQGPTARFMAELAERTASGSGSNEETSVDTDVFLVELEAGDVIAGGFDRSRVTGIIDPDGVERMGSGQNPTFIYPASSPLRHNRLGGFDHVAAVDGVHAVFVSEGDGTYEGELRVTRSGLGAENTDDQQIIFLDFDGAEIPAEIWQTPNDATLSPLVDFLDGWGLGPADEDEVIDATIDAVVESLDDDLRVLDGRNGDRDATGNGGEFDVEILNSRDHGDRWGDPNVSRVVIGGTIEEFGIGTLGIAQSIDPGNLDTEETAVVLLDIMSGPPISTASINSYEVAEGTSKASFVGFVVGHITVHEIGHFIGNWHQETFNDIRDAVMDAGGDFPAIAGVGDDLTFGTTDDTDPDFIEDEFNVFEGFTGIEDTAARSAFGLSTGQTPVGGGGPTDLVIELDGVAHPDDVVNLYGSFVGGEAPFTVDVDWGDGSGCPGTGSCSVESAVGDNPSIVDGSHGFGAIGSFTVTVTVTDANGATVSASADTATCTIIGTAGNDSLLGTSGDDVICGLSGRDRIVGGGGDDLIFGGPGPDRIVAGAGDDMVFGGSGVDIVYGGMGDDVISGGTSSDALWGGKGDDIVRGRDGADRVYGNSGVDLLAGDRNGDRLFGGGGGDTIIGGRGNDSATGQGGDDVIEGGEGRDTISGGNGDDDLSGGIGRDNLIGGAGDDSLDGGADSDRCVGGSGADTETSCER